MSRLTPVSWRELVRRLRALGFEGPLYGGKHPYMLKGNLSVAMPNPSRKQIGVNLRQRILKQAEISRDRWLQQM